MTAQSLQMPSWAADACYRSIFGTDLLADLPLVTQPVLQVIREDDPVQSIRGVRCLTDRLADSRLAMLPGRGHYAMFEAPRGAGRAAAGAPGVSCSAIAEQVLLQPGQVLSRTKSEARSPIM